MVQPGLDEDRTPRDPGDAPRLRMRVRSLRLSPSGSGALATRPRRVVPTGEGVQV